MSRLIDADALMEILTIAIRNMKDMAKFLDAEDDPEIQMEIKAYTDIANGIKGMPTIEERKTGKWILVTDSNGQHYVCDHCGEWKYHQKQKFCGECGYVMMGEGEQE